MSIIYEKISGAKICLPIEMNIKLIFILTISLIVKIVSYFVLPDHISTVTVIIDASLMHHRSKWTPWPPKAKSANCINNRFRFVYVMKRSGESCYRCTVNTCTAKLFISASDVVREGVAPHKNRNTVSDMNFEILRASCVISGLYLFYTFYRRILYISW